jgi:transcription initiation factor TFIID subunit 4
VKGKASSAKDAMVASEGGPVRMEDDDIMDVTSMAGVNLMEETAQMAASVSTLSGMTRSVKDDSFLSPDCLQQRVNEIGLKYGVEQISPEVYTLLSHAVEERLKNLIERLITVSQHRLEIHQVCWHTVP